MGNSVLFHIGALHAFAVEVKVDKPERGAEPVGAELLDGGSHLLAVFLAVRVHETAEVVLKLNVYL